MSYNGYLSPYVDGIKAQARYGSDPKAIAETLYRAGIRSPYGSDINAIAAMVAYILRGGNKKKIARAKPQPAKVTKIVQAWQTWTPEMQESEFQAGYTR